MVSDNVHPLHLASKLLVELFKLFVDQDNIAMPFHLVF
jgi:hypothetical protein